MGAPNPQNSVPFGGVIALIGSTAMAVVTWFIHVTKSRQERAREEAQAKTNREVSLLQMAITESRTEITELRAENGRLRQENQQAWALSNSLSAEINKIRSEINTIHADYAHRLEMMEHRHHQEMETLRNQLTQATDTHGVLSAAADLFLHSDVQRLEKKMNDAPPKNGDGI